MELLVVIAVVCVVLAITIPSLMKVRSVARGTSCQSNLSQLGVSMQMYLQTFQETFPFASAGFQFYASPPEDSSKKSFVSSGSHWDLSHWWMSLVGSVAPWRPNFVTWICAGARRRPGEPWVTESGEVPVSSYRFVYGFFARPEVWSEGSVADRALLKPVRASDVFAPSGKAMFVDAEMAHNLGGRPANANTSEGPATPILFADSHCRVLRPADAKPPARNPFTSKSLPLYDTPNGVRGVDY
jgi:hypothetical protein